MLSGSIAFIPLPKIKTKIKGKKIEVKTLILLRQNNKSSLCQIILIPCQFLIGIFKNRQID